MAHALIDPLGVRFFPAEIDQRANNENLAEQSHRQVILTKRVSLGKRFRLLTSAP
jgi:hypothetical protein